MDSQMAVSDRPLRVLFPSGPIFQRTRHHHHRPTLPPSTITTRPSRKFENLIGKTEARMETVERYVGEFGLKMYRVAQNIDYYVNRVILGVPKRKFRFDWFSREDGATSHNF